MLFWYSSSKQGFVAELTGIHRSWSYPIVANQNGPHALQLLTIFSGPQYYGVRPSVRLSVPVWTHSSKPAATGLVLWAGRAGIISIDCCTASAHQQRRANAGSATLSPHVVLLNSDLLEEEMPLVNRIGGRFNFFFRAVLSRGGFGRGRLTGNLADVALPSRTVYERIYRLLASCMPCRR